MRLLPYLDHLQNPPPAGTFVEVRLQQNPAIVIHQVAQSGVQVLPSSIDQLGAVFRIHLRQRCKMLPDVCSTTVLSLGIGKHFDDLLQSGNPVVVEAAPVQVRVTPSRVLALAHRLGPPVG